MECRGARSIGRSAIARDPPPPYRLSPLGAVAPEPFQLKSCPAPVPRQQDAVHALREHGLPALEHGLLGPEHGLPARGRRPPGPCDVLRGPGRGLRGPVRRPPGPCDVLRAPGNVLRARDALFWVRNTVSRPAGTVFWVRSTGLRLAGDVFRPASTVFRLPVFRLPCAARRAPVPSRSPAGPHHELRLDLDSFAVLPSAAQTCGVSTPGALPR